MRVESAVVSACLAAAGCGRFGFELARTDEDAASVAEDAVALDDTRCDELTGVLYCDGFEGTSPLTNPTEAPSFAVADGTRAYRGQRALHTQTTRSGEPAWWHGGVVGGVVDGDLYARWYLYVPAQPATLQVALTHLLSNTLPYPGVIMSVRSPRIMVSSTEADMEAGTSTTIPRERWVCMQLHVRISEANGVVEGRMDGALVGELTGVDTRPSDGYVNLHVGHYAQDDEPDPVELWTDEMIVSTSPIPCD